jgi:hypothetical protein
MRRATFATCVALVTLATAPANAAQPVEGKWFNGSRAHGGYMVTKGRSVQELWLFCRQDVPQDAPEMRAARYVVPVALHVDRDGHFAWHGKGYRFGPEGQPLGRWKMRVSGRFVSSRKVRIERTLTGCGKPATTTIHPGS